MIKITETIKFLQVYSQLWGRDFSPAFCSMKRYQYCN